MSEPRAYTNPFPGLRPFETDEYRLFFGREGQSDALIERLQRSRFLAVVGTSGSGKSSLVRAGLMPALRGGMMAGAGAGWRVAVMRPGHDPIGNLARVLAGEGVLAELGAGLPAAEAEAIIEATLRRGSLGLVDAARQARLAGHEKLLVIVDQFEELFRFRAARATTDTDDDASAFVKLLLETKQADKPTEERLPIYVVVTMRSDFLGDCAQFQGLPEAINDGQYLIPRMTRDERRFAISGPVRVSRGKMSEPLVNRLLNDVGDNPDQLPILQHALMRTWDYWQRNRLEGEPIGIEHYEAVGTMSDALSKHADEAYNELSSERSRRVAESLFKALTERGTDNRDIRRPTRLSEICKITGASIQEVAYVVEVFRREERSFLMPPVRTPLNDSTVIDISHESLIRNWDKLKQWVRDEAESARIYRRLADAAVAYSTGEGGLLDDVTLQWVLRWRDKYAPNRAWGVQYHPEFDAAMNFLEVSREASEKRIAEGQEREQRELERTRVFAEQQTRTARRLRRLSVALGLIMLLALGSAVYAFNARTDALQSRKEAEDSARDAVTDKKQALMAAESARQAEKIALGKTEEARVSEKAAKASEEVALKAKEHAASEEARAEKEAQRATEQASLAARNAEAAREAARREKELGAIASDGFTRGKLIRSGLESFRREDFSDALESFIALSEHLKGFEPGSPPPPGERNFSPEQIKQLINDYGWTLSQLGDTYHKLHDFDSAIKSYEKARVILENVLGDAPAPILFETYHGLAHAYHDKATAPTRAMKPNNEEQFKKAEEFYKKAALYQERFKSDNPLAAVVAYKNLAQLYTDLGEFDNAEQSLKLVVGVYRKAEDTTPDEGTFGALKELAEFYRGQSRYAEAAKTYNELIDLQESARDAEDLRPLTDNYSELGQVYSAQKDDERADTTFQLVNKLQQIALKIKHKGGDLNPTDADTTYDDDLDEVGDIYVRLGRFAEAKRSYEESVLIRTTVEEKKSALPTSYEKLAHLYHEHLSEKDRAEEYYKLLIEATKDAVGNQISDNTLRQHVDGLRGLGALDAGALNKPAEAETLFNRALAALAPVNARMAWEDDVALYSALLDLYRRQPDKGREIEQTYARKLETMTKLHGEFTSGYYRTEDYPQFMAAYFQAVGEVAAFYLKQKNIARAEAVYPLAFRNAGSPFFERSHEPKALDDMASALEECQTLLREQKKPDEAAKLDGLIKEARARQKELEAQEKEIEQLRRQQQTPRQDPPKP